MNYFKIVILLILTVQRVHGQIPVELYRNEIKALKSKEDVQMYWNNLKSIDQDFLVNIENIQLADSVSVDLMIRTALMFELLGDSCYSAAENTLPILNLAHNNVGSCQVSFWPIIEKCAKMGGVILTFGGKYPAYELESISNSFYNYSLLNQEYKYDTLLSVLHEASSDSVVENLIEKFNQLKNQRVLHVIEVINSWFIQPFEQVIEKTFFQFVLMSDNQVYVYYSGRYQKLKELESKGDIRVFRIENEPFGWTYEYHIDGSLILKDELGTNLIIYTKVGLPAGN